MTSLSYSEYLNYRQNPACIISGPTGDRGPTGPRGDTGHTGHTGPRGPAGNNGGTGAQGSTGHTGHTGHTGPIGPSGTNGTNGTNGNDGPTGPTGPAGTNADNTPVGSVIAYAGSSAPSGWLICDGVLYPIASYPALHSVIGYTFGGAGLNFRVPNLQQKFIAGADPNFTGSDGYDYSLGEDGGEQTHTLTIAEMPTHTHTAEFQRLGADAGNGGNGSGDYNLSSQSSGYLPFFSTVTTATGGSQPHNNTPLFLALNYIIKY